MKFLKQDLMLVEISVQIFSSRFCLNWNQGLGPTLFAGDFVLARVYHAKGSERPELYVAEVRVFMNNIVFLFISLSNVCYFDEPFLHKIWNFCKTA